MMLPTGNLGGFGDLALGALGAAATPDPTVQTTVVDVRVAPPAFDLAQLWGMVNAPRESGGLGTYNPLNLADSDNRAFAQRPGPAVSGLAAVLLLAGLVYVALT
jgi:hypothetical protein